MKLLTPGHPAPGCALFGVGARCGTEDWLPLQARRREAEEEIDTDEEEVQQF